MKTVLIHGQNHRGSTYHMGRLLAEKLATEEEITEFFLPRDLNHHCLGCMACMEDEAKCPFFPEKRIIAEAMEDAELLIFTTPTYCMAPSAPMKAFMDLFFQYWLPHRPRASMFRKKAVVLSTTAARGTKEAIRPIKRMLACWGVPWVKTYGMAVWATEWAGVTDSKKKKLDRDMTRLAQKVSTAKPGKPALYVRLLFGLMAKMKEKEADKTPGESAYWRQRGWLDGARPWKNRRRVICSSEQKK